MRFNMWLTKFCIAINNRCIYTTNELREACKNGRSPQEVAEANDAIAAEYAEMEIDIAA